MGATSLHFSDDELRCQGTDCGPTGHGCGENKCDQALVDGLERFRAMASVAWLLKHRDKFASAFPGVRVHDAYRCPQHNKGTSGAAADSQHPAGTAADISVDGLTAGELERIANEAQAFKGIGRDDLRNFIHVDTRQAINVARWSYYRDKDGRIKWGAYRPPPVIEA